MGRLKRTYNAPIGLIKRPNTPYWYISFQKKGIEVCTSTKTEDLEEATRLLYELKKSIFGEEDLIESVKKKIKFKPKDEHFTTMWIYFIQADDGPIKIGITLDVHERLKHLSIVSYHELKLLGFMRGNLLEERAIQERFKRHRIRGEWFSPSESILKFIKENCPNHERICKDYPLQAELSANDVR